MVPDGDRNRILRTILFLDDELSKRLLSAAVPKELGGGGAGMVELAEMCMTLAQGCGSSGMVLAMHHIQIASIPSRNEPDGEELNYPFLFAELDRLGYGGFVGCEYNPRAKTTDGLGWFKPYAGAKP